MQIGPLCGWQIDYAAWMLNGYWVCSNFKMKFLHRCILHCVRICIFECTCAAQSLIRTSPHSQHCVSEIKRWKMVEMKRGRESPSIPNLYSFLSLRDSLCCYLLRKKKRKSVWSFFVAFFMRPFADCTSTKYAIAICVFNDSGISNHRATTTTTTTA